MAETLFLRGTLQGHSDMVTAIAVQIKGQARNVSSSRDKSLLVWNLNSLALSANGLVGEGESAPTVLGKPFHRLTGHTHYVQDVVLSSDSMFALSCSRDGMNVEAVGPVDWGHRTAFCGPPQVCAFSSIIDS